MNAPDEHDPLNDIAESFMAKLRCGETPSVSEYAARHPHLAEEIRDLFPTLAMLEQVGERAGDGQGQVETAGQTTLTQIGDYKIVREVGHGGMGVVYEAYQKTLGRKVALKVLLGPKIEGAGLVACGRDGQDSLRLLRFQREARAAARLHHTNIVPVYEVGVHQGVHFYSMQFIEGEGLDKVWQELRRNKLATGGATNHSKMRGSKTDSKWDRALTAKSIAQRLGETLTAAVSSGSSIGKPNTSESGVAALIDQVTEVSSWWYYWNIAHVAMQVVEALAAAHREGILHRDIKPSNIILDTSGRAWVTDFGLAKTQDDSLTRTGDIVGTLRYMSPERFSRDADARSDVYSAGLTLYEFLVLRPAFSSTDRAQLLRQIQNAELPRPRKIDPAIPRDLETIVLKAIDKDPRRRYQTAAAFAEDLRRFISDQPILARRVSAAEHVWRWCRRNRAVASLAASAAGLLAALVLVVVLGLARFTVALQEHADSLGAEKAKVEQAELEGRRRLFVAHQNEARAERWSARAGQRLDSLNALSQAANLLPALGLAKHEQSAWRLALRNEAIACSALTDLEVAQTVRTPPNNRALAIDARLERYAYGDKTGEIAIGSFGRRKTSTLPGFGVRVWQLQFSADGRYLAAKYANGSCRIRVWDLTKPKDKPVLDTPMLKNGRAFDFHPDSNIVAMGKADKTVRLYDLKTGQWSATLAVKTTPRSIRFDTSGKTLAITDGGRRLRLWDLTSHRQSASFDHPRKVYSADFSDDGKLLAAACEDYRIYVWNRQTGKQQAVCIGHQNEVTRVAFQPGGSLLCSSGWDTATRLWDPWTGRLLVRAQGAGQHFAPNGRRLAFHIENITAGSRLGYWNVIGGRVFKTLHEPPAPGKGPGHVDISPHGRWMVSAGDDGVRLWDLHQDKELALLVGQVGTSTPHPTTFFTPPGDGLITSGELGVSYWPIHTDASSLAVRLRIGPPKRLYTSRTYLANMSDPKTLAFVHSQHAHVYRRAASDHWRTLRVGGARIRRVILNPSGKWLATAAGRRGRGVKVFDAHSGKLIEDLWPDAHNPSLAFSPDGKWFVAATAGKYRFWEIPSAGDGLAAWREAHEIPRADVGAGNGGGPIAFSRDGALMAIGYSWRVLMLVDPQTGRQLATLEAPDLQGVAHLCFQQDGAVLAAACHAAHRIQLWDIRLLRQKLRVLNLDWPKSFLAPARSSPIRSSSPQSSDQPKPVEVVVDRGVLEKLNDPSYRLAARHDSQGRKAAAARKWPQAIAEYAKAIHQKPDFALARNNLAWLLATCPQAKYCNPQLAVRHAEKAVQLSPKVASYWNTLGAARLRAEDWPGAVEALEKSEALSPGAYLGFNGFLLAMAHWRLNHQDQARRWFENAEKWTKKNKPRDAELRRFQAEAAQMISAQKLGGPNPPSPERSN